MPTFYIEKTWGFAGDTEACLIEADTLEEAAQIAWQEACEQVEAWGEPYDPEKHDAKL